MCPNTLNVLAIIEMPKIKVKSLENLKAAQKLIDCGMYTTSVHCSYYSSFFSMKHFLNKHPHNSINYIDQDKYNNAGSHIFIYEEVYNRVLHNSTHARKFRTEYKILKEERKRADYTDEQFTAEESLDSIQRSKNIQYTLNEIFKKL